MSSGRSILPAWVSGETASIASRPSGVVQSPMRVLNTEMIGFQYGGAGSASVMRFDGPTVSTPQRKVVGARRPDAHAHDLPLRRRHRRPVEPHHARRVGGG